MQALDWQWLKSQCMAWIKDKCNDVKAEQDRINLGNEAKSKGFTNLQVSQAIHKCRKLIDESSRDKQHTEPVQQPESREAEQVPQLQGVQEKTEQELSRRAQHSNQPVPDGLTSSGTRKSGAAGGRSIVDGIL